MPQVHHPHTTYFGLGQSRDVLQRFPTIANSESAQPSCKGAAGVFTASGPTRPGQGSPSGPLVGTSSGHVHPKEPGPARHGEAEAGFAPRPEAGSGRAGQPVLREGAPPGPCGVDGGAEPGISFPRGGAAGSEPGR